MILVGTFSLVGRVLIVVDGEGGGGERDQDEHHHAAPAHTYLAGTTGPNEKEDEYFIKSQFAEIATALVILSGCVG